MKQRLYIKDGKIYDIAKGVNTRNGTVLYNGTETEMRELGYEPYVPAPYQPSQEVIIQDEINYLKEQLAETDYIAIKSFEGYDCDTLYPGWKAQRASIRQQINEKEEQLENLTRPQD